MKSTASAPQEQLTGIIKTLTFFNPENGYFVAKVTVGAKGERTVTGSAPVINVGEQISARGTWQSSNWGPQFKASEVVLSAPTMLEGIEKYLSNAIHGIGKGYAKKMVEAFGESIFDIIEKEPEKLKAVKGIGPKRGTAIIEAYKEQQAVREIMVFLHRSGLSTSRAHKVYKAYGDTAIEKIKENPYILSRDIWGIGFSTADAVALKQGILPDSDYRIRAGVQHVLREAEQQGSCGLPFTTVREKAAEILAVDYDLIEKAIEFEIEAEELVKDTASDEVCLFTPRIYKAEKAIADMLLAHAKRVPARKILDLTQALTDAQVEMGLALDPAQLDAVQAAATNQLCIITGGPGTGKCVVKGTLIHTSEGLMPIEALCHQHPAVDDTKMISATVLTLAGWQKARGFYNGGVKPTLKLVTQQGFELCGTHVHPVLVQTSAGPAWKRLQEVVPGDKVGISTYQNDTPGLDTDVAEAYLAGVLTRNSLCTGLTRGAAETRVLPEMEERYVVAALEGEVPREILTGGSAAWVGYLEGLLGEEFSEAESVHFSEKFAKQLQVLAVSQGILFSRKQLPSGKWVLSLDASQPTSSVTWQSVKAVSDNGLQPVYDLTVPGQAHFVANGIFAHNTSITKVLLQVFKNAGLSAISLAAPTGKAAKRASEATGMPAGTIHRTLVMGKDGKFEHNELNPLESDVLVVDEFSMVDVPLMLSVMKAVAPHTRLLIVGDVDQLPSVGPGKVLSDMIQSGALPTVRLTKIFRQAATSQIIRNAHAVNAGDMPELGYKEGSDFQFLSVTPAKRDDEEEKKKCRETIEKEVVRITTSMYKLGYDPIKDVQVLAPMRRGILGVDALNVRLQQALNPTPSDFLEVFGTRWGTGDKVMQLRNNYDKKVYNGDIGYVHEIDKDERVIYVDFDGNLVPYKTGDLDELTLAYAFTIHKSQGSEFPVMVMPLDWSHFTMLKRNLFYTGITRAKKLCVVVGQPQAAAKAVETAQNEERYSRLKDWLSAGLPSEMRRALVV